MPKKAKISNELFGAALEAARVAETGDDLRLAQSIIIPYLLGIADQTAAELLGRSRGTVLRLRDQFKRLHAGQKPGARNWGGRRYGYMTLEEEGQFLSEFFEQAAHGGVLVVGEIKRAFEARIGKKVAKTTIYRMLERHGWRKIVPRPRHPKSDIKAHKGFKKTSKLGDPL